MLQGRVRAALRLLSDHEHGFPLQLDKMVGSKSVREILLDKHPCGRPLDPLAVAAPVPQLLIHTQCSLTILLDL